MAQFAPRVAGLAYTAPVYDETTKPTQAPYPAACISSKERCQCYTQQGTHLDVGGEAMCRSISRGGFFVAWSQPKGEPANRGSGIAGGWRLGLQVQPSPVEQ